MTSDWETTGKDHSQGQKAGELTGAEKRQSSRAGQVEIREAVRKQKLEGLHASDVNVARSERSASVYAYTG